MLTQSQIEAIAEAVASQMQRGKPKAVAQDDHFNVGVSKTQTETLDGFTGNSQSAERAYAAQARTPEKKACRTDCPRVEHPRELQSISFIPGGEALSGLGTDRLSSSHLSEDTEGLVDITSPGVRKTPLLNHIEDPEGLERMMSRTTARIGVGKCGARLKTRTMLTLRADHAAARDAVFKDVSQELLDRLGLFSVQTCCKDKDEFLTRPDLGRIFSEENMTQIKSKCQQHVDVEIYASDGLSSTAIEANLENILPIMMDGMKAKGLSVGTPFFVKHGRVAAMDQVSVALDATVTCVLIGERPGLATAESMSAYIAYKATPGMPEARRTVVSNIHAQGIPAVEAGAYIVDVIQKIYEAKASGVELKK